jgi:hypothetical protein
VEWCARGGGGGRGGHGAVVAGGEGARIDENGGEATKDAEHAVGY